MDYTKLKGRHFLVTGGAGFIGSNIVEVLLSKGAKVRVLDDFSTGKKSNIAKFMKNSNCTLIEGDIRDYDTCAIACEGIDYVLHQAALGSVPRSIKDPITSHQVNSTGTLNMLEAAKENHVKRFVYASSSSVYGDEPNLPKIEDRIGKPLSPYAITKKTCELYAKNFFELYGLKTIGLRYFNVFGPNQDTDSIYAAVIPIFVSKCINGEQATINGDGSYSRDFTYVENVVNANLQACFAGDEACGEVYNIAAGGRTTINDLYFTIARALNVDANPIYGDCRAGDVPHSNASIEKANRLLGFEPKVGFEEGIEKAVKWYVENLR